MSNILKWKAVDCLSDRPSKIIHWALIENRTLDASESDLEWFCKNMNEVQASVCPLLPKNLSEWH